MVDTIPTIKSIIEDIKAKKTNVRDILKLKKDIQNVYRLCKKPFCLDDAKQRCLNENPSGCQQWGLIFYPNCRSGFSNFDCCICNQNCPSGFADQGAFCAKPGSYGRGAGYPWKFGDKAFNYDAAKRRCENDNHQGCEQNGLIYYPRCAENFHAVGCCVCSPNCPSSMADIGVSCTKQSYGRGFGYPFELNDCQFANTTYPFNFNGLCNEKLDQMLAPMSEIVSLVNQQNT